ncbi:Two-component signal transduction system YycFG, regulatory protein YycH [Pelagirhabdus alkalitolerans]|uniref:Two-component signal transduction system YycFG, regulatory protein YycH n=1 Tax=Pelagirhabdus alkalitolerans TaxID=1612202 RepID=A0A1G6LHA3_9BACI|nr:two-component system activity regulator YycH [Pelagirhabdus alkalitolerans]SDC41946.1 Two-component signal transduction system YycFG, regulatory protein YycH [Pelagirhabdus alkalitolerans]
MQTEHLKSVLLIALIVSSLLLTLALWNHQPDFEVVQTEDDLVDAQLEDGHRLTKRDVLSPTEFVFHTDQSLAPLALLNQEREQALFEQVQEISLYNFSVFNLNEEWWEDHDNRLEIMFPTTYSSAVIYDVFGIDADEQIPTASFNRIEIVLDHDGFQVVFRNDEDERVIGASMQNYSDEVEELEAFMSEEEVVSLDTIESSRGQTIYLPNEFDRDVLLFSYTEIPSEPFQSVLFTNPSVVRSGYTTEGYTNLVDGTRELIIQPEQISFTNLTNEQQSEEHELTHYELLDQVQNFINTHNGFAFEEPFHYFVSEVENNPNSSVVEYSMSYEGIPIFYNQEIASMSVAWHNQEVYQYERPLISLVDYRGVGRKASEVPSSEDVIDILESENYRGSAIYDVTLGYRVREQDGSQGQVYELVPSWYVKGVHGWHPLIIPSEYTGGDQRAMGAN